MPGQDFIELIEDAVEETGVNLQVSAADLAAYTSERATHLSLAVGEPGFQQAVRAERNNVAARAALNIEADADAADQRMIGLLQGALAMAASALADAAAEQG